MPFFIQLCEAKMVKYTCKNCNITTELSECPHCGERTEIADSTVYWCECCNVPIFDEHCPICGSKGKRLGSDIRPVFPQERLLLEILLDCPLKYKNSSVWNTAGSYYYADGEKICISSLERTCISFLRSGGSLHPTAGFITIRFSAIAFSSAL